jgi:hypothetical protein
MFDGVWRRSKVLARPHVACLGACVIGLVSMQVRLHVSFDSISSCLTCRDYLGACRLTSARVCGLVQSLRCVRCGIDTTTGVLSWGRTGGEMKHKYPDL